MNCRRCDRPIDVTRDGHCRICAWCQADDRDLDRTPEPGAILRRVPGEAKACPA